MPEIKVLDSWALLAWLLDQPAASQVDYMLQRAEAGSDLQLLMSWVNVGEVYYTAARKRGPVHADEFLQGLPSVPVRLVLPDEADMIAAAKLKATRRISFADGFAVALAQREKAILVTGDPELYKMTGVVGIHWIGSANASLS